MENKKLSVRYTGDYYKYSLRKGKVYAVEFEKDGWYAIVDESGEKYAFPNSMFDIVNEDDDEK